MANSLKKTDEEVCEDANKFCTLFYEAFDRRRQVVNKMYDETACMVWNGNPMAGQQSIAMFIESIPPTEHTVKCLDAQSVSSAVTHGRSAMLLNAAGTVRINNRTRSFTQTFIITQVGEIWKIASDRYRFVD